MCAEKDPLECHRAILISRVLDEKGIEVKHVLGDGGIETQSELVTRMLNRLDLHSEDMLSSKDELVKEAYRAQGEAIAYEDEAMRETTSALSRATDLLALATAPPPSSAHIHRDEVLLLQPQVAMVVVIASNGAVTRRMFSFADPLDPGLVQWASSYLNERLSGMALGARMIESRASSHETPSSSACAL